ncbi:Holliday junction branch migration protein RuvA [Enterococcus sp. LJL98]
MYEYIKGKITGITPAYIVLENQGVGYQIQCGNPYYYAGKEAQEQQIFVHQVIREDAHQLYGFKTIEEKKLFLRLISVSGIGPKSGLAIMANEDHLGLIQAIESNDVTYLMKFPGVGKKTSQQLILDLQGKLGDILEEGLPVKQPQLFDGDHHLEEALEALKALGYSEREVKKVQKELQKNVCSTTDEYLRIALKLIMKK